MAVAVVGTHRHQGDRRAGGGQEARVGVAAAVVGHLEHVGGQVGARAEDLRLGLGAEVTGEQHPDAPLGGPEHQAEVVGVDTRGGPGRIGCEHLELRAVDAASLPRHQHDVLGSHGGQQPLQLRHPVVGRGQRAGGHLADLSAGERAGQSADVVGVQVREQHQRQPLNAEPVQAAGHQGTLGAGVDQHRLAGGGGQHQRVALPDIAGDHDRVRQRPSPADLPQRPAERDDPDERSDGQRPQPGPAHQRPRPAGQQQREENRTSGAGRPRRRAVGQRRGALGDHHEPPHRPAGEPGEDVGRTRGHR